MARFNERDTGLPPGHHGIEVTEILTEGDRVSYVTGLTVARAIADGETMIDRQLFLAGVKDGIENRPSLLGEGSDDFEMPTNLLWSAG